MRNDCDLFPMFEFNPQHEDRSHLFVHSLEQHAIAHLLLKSHFQNNICTVTNGVLWRDMSLGTSSLFPSINIIGWTSNNLLPESGHLSPIFLLIPAAVGAAVVGSFERRISLWLKEKKAKGKRTD